MFFLDILNNLNAIWLVIIIAIGMCFITISVVLILLEKAKRQTVEDFSQKDKTMIIGLVEERIDELTAKMDIFREDMETATQAVFSKITSKVDELKANPANQNQNSKIEVLIPVISDLTEHIESISKKTEDLQKMLERIQSKLTQEIEK